MPSTPSGLVNWVQTGSKTKLIRHGRRGIDGSHVALFSLSRDGDNTNFPYTCGIAHRPHESHRLSVILVFMAAFRAAFVSRDEDNMNRRLPSITGHTPPRHYGIRCGTMRG
jgi:hypothetical protein